MNSKNKARKEEPVKELQALQKENDLLKSRFAEV